MDEIAKSGVFPHCGGASPLAFMAQRLAAEIARLDAHAGRTVVLVPYAQLTAELRDCWTLAFPQGFAPRFETPMGWASSMGGLPGSGDDIAFDMAHDLLTAQHFLEQAGLADLQKALARPLVQAAHQLGQRMAAIAPAVRGPWVARARLDAEAVADAPVLALEAALARIALEWAAASAYRTDLLYAEVASDRIDAVLALHGVNQEPLAAALVTHSQGRGKCIALAGAPDLHDVTDMPERLVDDARTGHAELTNPPGMSQLDELPDPHKKPRSAMHQPAAYQPAARITCYPATGAEDEAARAAACVIRHIIKGNLPVALVAIDRALARRVRAMLDAQRVTIRDDSGWKLSTTRAAAHLVVALEASRWDASADTVLDWLKHSPLFADVEVQALEKAMRRSGIRDWQRFFASSANEAAAPDGVDLPALQLRINNLRATLHNRRTLHDWLSAMRSLLHATGQWPLLESDAAGSAVIAALRLEPSAQQAFAQQLAHSVWATRRIGPAEWLDWAKSALEAGSFTPLSSPKAQVVILPMNQLLGRKFGAVVMPGCDETRLPVSPELPGIWTPAQRESLGLATRSQMQTEMRATWHMALATAPWCDLLWRTCDDGGETLLPSPLVQMLQQSPQSQSQSQPKSQSSPLLQIPAGGQGLFDIFRPPHQSGVPPQPDLPTLGADPRALRRISISPTLPPQPVAPALVPGRLSASAYEDLRRCPYRFFALRLLGLQESDELESDIGKRDFGLWLHAALNIFQVALQAGPTQDETVRRALLDDAAEQATAQRQLSPAEFLPFSAVWPQVREGYLVWLARHADQDGAQFGAAERWMQQPLGATTLVGQIDRTDRTADGTTLVIDYKTEVLDTTRKRLNDPTEDTQLAFYAALLPDDTLRAAYVNVGEGGTTRTVELEQVVEVRDLLLEGIAHDLQRIARGAAMPALGEGAVCNYCAARGLCRKDFWPAHTAGSPVFE